MSRLDYSNSLFVGWPKCVFDRLRWIMNAAARVIAGASRRDRITPILKRLHWLPVDFNLSLKSLKGIASVSLRNNVNPYHPKRTFRKNQVDLSRL